MSNVTVRVPEELKDRMKRYKASIGAKVQEKPLKMPPVKKKSKALHRQSKPPIRKQS